MSTPDHIYFTPQMMADLLTSCDKVISESKDPVAVSSAEFEKAFVPVFNTFLTTEHTKGDTIDPEDGGNVASTARALTALLTVTCRYISCYVIDRKPEEPRKLVREFPFDVGRLYAIELESTYKRAVQLELGKVASTLKDMMDSNASTHQ